MIHFPCPDGGIGRRARLKLVYLGVWVRFPLRVLTRTKRPLKKFRGFFVSYHFLIILEALKKLKISNKFQNTRYVFIVELSEELFIKSDSFLIFYEFSNAFDQ